MSPLTQPAKDASFRGAKGDSVRLASLDAYRGFIMFLMASGGFGIGAVAKKLPDSFWVTLAPHVDHVPWVGCVLWDLIQPAFMFMVGVAAAYSTANRLRKGDSLVSVLLHAAARSLALVLLGVLLASNWDKRTSWVFTNVLAQIGLGYFFLVLLARTSFRVQLVALVSILVGYWLLFAAWPLHELPLKVDTSWIAPTEWLTGFFAHWNPHTNFAADFDVWFLNLFPRSEPYVVTKGGYQTLNFVPSLATMLMGLMTGEMLRREGKPEQKLQTLFIAGLSCLVVGWLLGQTACPLVKRIWTPSFAIYSTGWVLLMLAAFYWVIDVQNWRAWSLPFTVIGMNSIFFYMGAQLSAGWIRETLTRHLGPELFTGDYLAMVQRAGVLVVLWLLAWWLYAQKVFLRL